MSERCAVGPTDSRPWKTVAPSVLCSSTAAPAELAAVRGGHRGRSLRRGPVGALSRLPRPHAVLNSPTLIGDAVRDGKCDRNRDNAVTLRHALRPLTIAFPASLRLIRAFGWEAPRVSVGDLCGSMPMCESPQLHANSVPSMTGAPLRCATSSAAGSTRSVCTLVRRRSNSSR